MTDTAHIQGSDGYLVANRATGAILSRDGADMGAGYPAIDRMDASTLTGSHLDILECGYWDAKGGYEPPEPEFLAHVADIAAGGEDLL